MDDPTDVAIAELKSDQPIDWSFMDKIPAPGSPLDTALIAIAQRQGRISAELSALDHAVRRARAEGASWSQIGDAAFMSKQAAHKRWGDDITCRTCGADLELMEGGWEHARGPGGEYVGKRHKAVPAEV